MGPRRLLSLLVPVALLACHDEGPPADAGVLTGTLVSPHGDEGAALVVLFGPGPGEVRDVAETEVYRRTEHGLTRLVLINRAGGPLSFEVTVPDVRDPPVAVVLEVAGPDDQLRAGLGSYRVDFAR